MNHELIDSMLITDISKLSKIKDLLHNNGINDYLIIGNHIVIMNRDADKVRELFDKNNISLCICYFDNTKLDSKNTPTDTVDNKIEDSIDDTSISNKKYNIPVMLINDADYEYSENVNKNLFASKYSFNIHDIGYFRSVIDVLNIVFNSGMNKYGPLSWEKEFSNKLASTDRYSYSAIIRHLSLSAISNWMYDESGLPHLFHALCRSAMLLTYLYRNGRPLDIESDVYKHFIDINNTQYIEHYSIPPEVFVWFCKINDIESNMPEWLLKSDHFYKNKLSDTLIKMKIDNIHDVHKSISRALLALVTPILLKDTLPQYNTIEDICNKVTSIDYLVYIIGYTLHHFIQHVCSLGTRKVIEEYPQLDVIFTSKKKNTI